MAIEKISIGACKAEELLRGTRHLLCKNFCTPVILVTINSNDVAKIVHKLDRNIQEMPTAVKIFSALAP